MDYSFMTENMRSFMGTGLLLILFFAAVLFLGLRLENGFKKTMLVWFPLFVLAIYFCPIWGLYMKLRDDSEILYRIFWMIPIGVITIYAAVEALDLLPEKYRGAGFIGGIVLIVLCGKYVYVNPQFHKADNVYHIPQTIVDICDDIAIPGREVRACFPIEMVQYVRQYTPLVCQPYGRDTLLRGAENEEYSKVGTILEQDVVDTKELTEVLRERDTPYLIMKSDTKVSEDVEKYGYKLVEVYSDYFLYIDEYYDIEFKEK